MLAAREAGRKLVRGVMDSLDENGREDGEKLEVWMLILRVTSIRTVRVAPDRGYRTDDSQVVPATPISSHEARKSAYVGFYIQTLYIRTHGPTNMRTERETITT